MDGNCGEFVADVEEGTFLVGVWGRGNFVLFNKFIFLDVNGEDEGGGVNGDEEFDEAGRDDDVEEASDWKPVIEKKIVSTSCSRSFSWNLDKKKEEELQH